MTKTLAFILSASLAACAGEAEVRYSGNASTPELVAMDSDPSVMVVANSDEPVFYSENSYWLFRGQRWYRSSSPRGRWSQIDQVPDHVRRIDRPTAYVHYRQASQAVSPPRTSYNQRPVVQERTTEPTPARATERAVDARPAQPRPVVTPERPSPSLDRPEPTLQRPSGDRANERTDNPASEREDRRTDDRRSEPRDRTPGERRPDDKN